MTENLKDFIKIIETKKFEYGARNPYLYYDYEEKKWDCDYAITKRPIGVIILDENSKRTGGYFDLIRELNYEEVTVEEFEKVWQERGNEDER